MTATALAEALLRISRRDPAAPRSPATIRELSGAALDQLRATEVLVPGAGGRPAWATAMARDRVMWAFTDEEAYVAWTARQPAHVSAGWTPAKVGGGRKHLGEIIREFAGDLLVINPAGPGAVLWPASYVRSRSSGPSVRKALLQPMDVSLADPAARAEVRAAIDRSVSSARAALGAGRKDEVDAAVAAGRRPADELGDLHATASFDELAVRARLVDDPVGSELTRALLNSAYYWSKLGQAREGASLLVIGGQRAVTALEAGSSDPWLRQALGLVAAQLAILDLPEYRADAATALAWSRRYPARAG